jgi:hypothetical protein
MTAPQFTPGPWHYLDTDEVVGSEPDGFPSDTLICGLAGEITEPNGNLIAAAPELYAKVEIAAAIFREYERLHLGKGTRDGDAKARRNAQYADEMEAASAKARGEA